MQAQALAFQQENRPGRRSKQARHRLQPDVHPGQRYKDDEEDKTGLVFGDSIVELIILEFMINDLMP